MELRELQRHWDEFGKTDPLWAILMDPERKGRRWNLAEFFQSGDTEIAGLIAHIKGLERPAKFSLALDFGCGVGRLSQALCRYFDACVGIDIAPSMVELANKYNLYGSRCEYHLNKADDLGSFPADRFDFIYSNIVLQHMEPKYSSRYIQEFVRVMTPGGLAVFQVPSEPAMGTKVQPLSDSGFAAKIRCGCQGQLRVAAQESVRVPVKVKNISAEVWPSQESSAGCTQIRLGNHWWNSDRSPAIFDDARLDLPAAVRPGEELELVLTVTAPSHPGSYVLEIDMLQEYVSWFKVKGSESAEVLVEVAAPGQGTRTRQPGVPEPEVFEPLVEMYGIPREEVLHLVKKAGGHVLEVQDDCCAGREWISYRYFVTKL